MNGTSHVTSSSTGDIPTHEVSGTRHSWSDEGVTVVQDSASYLRQMHKKPPTTQWVRGLSYEDEENERQMELQRTMAERARVLRDAEERQARMEAKERRWLSGPILLAALYVLLLLSQQATSVSAMRRDFPRDDAEASFSARRAGEPLSSFLRRVAVPLAFPSAVAATASGWMCLVVGSATHRFLTLCGVGVALLVVLAYVGQVLLLTYSCGVSDISGRWECDVPYVLHWLCSVARVGCPLIAMLLVGPVIDEARGGMRWRCLLAVPPLTLALALAMIVYGSTRSTRMLQLVHELTVPVWILFIATLWRQKKFVMPTMIPPPNCHED